MLIGSESSSSTLSRASAAAVCLTVTSGCPGNFCSFNTPLAMTSCTSSLLWSYCLWRPTFGKGRLIWKKTHLFKKSNPFLLLSMFRIFGNFTTTIARFHSHSPHLPDQLALLQTSDTADSAHILVSIHPKPLFAAVLWQLFPLSGPASWGEQRAEIKTTKGLLCHQLRTKEIRDCVSSLAKLWQFSNMNTNAYFSVSMIFCLYCSAFFKLLIKPWLQVSNWK